MGYTPHVLVVGGDPVGAGIARDLAIRGLDVTLVEPGPLAGGATGRMPGLLASGATIAREDPDLATKCLAEHRRLSEIAAHCVDESGGLLVPDEGFEQVKTACEECGIETEVLTGDEAREREPGLSADIERALAVPDAALDPYQLTIATARDAQEFDADVRSRTAVTDIRVEDGTIAGVTLEHDPLPSTVDPEERDDDSAEDDETDEAGSESAADDSEDAQSETDEMRSDGGSTEKQVPGMVGQMRGEAAKRLAGPVEKTETRPEVTVEDIDVDYIVNAAGGRAGAVTERAGLSLPVERETETAVVGAEQAVTAPVLTGAGPRAVPFSEHTVFEADVETSGGERADDRPGVGRRPETVDRVCDAVGETVPEAAESRAIRSFGYTRYAVPNQVPGGHRFALIDHGDQHDCWGMLTVLGGSATTHRLVAERVSDVVCGEFGIWRECQTDDIVLPGSEDVPDLAEAVGTFGLAESVYDRSKARLGSRASVVLHSDDANPVLCECQAVCRAEVREAIGEPSTTETDLDAVRTRTSATMGECQGGRCAHRLAAQLHPDQDRDIVEGALTDLLDGRWRGQRGVVGTGQLAEMGRNYRLHAATMNRKHPPAADAIEDYDDGTRSASDDEGDSNRAHTDSDTRPLCCLRAGGDPPFATVERLDDRLEVGR